MRSDPGAGEGNRLESLRVVRAFPPCPRGSRQAPGEDLRSPSPRSLCRGLSSGSLHHKPVPPSTVCGGGRTGLFLGRTLYSSLVSPELSVGSALLGLTAHACASTLSEPYSICEGRSHPLSHQGWKFPSYLGLLPLPHFPAACQQAHPTSRDSGVHPLFSIPRGAGSAQSSSSPTWTSLLLGSAPSKD